MGRRAGLRAVDHHRRGRYLPCLGGAPRPVAMGGCVQQSRAEFAVDAAVHLGLRGEPSVRAGSRATGRGALHFCGVPALPEADAGTPRAMAGVCLPGVQPVRLRPSGGRARIRSGARISDGLARHRGVHAPRCGGVCPVLGLRGAFLRRQLFVRIRQCVCDAGDFDLGLRPHAGGPDTRPASWARACCRDCSCRFF